MGALVAFSEMRPFSRLRYRVSPNSRVPPPCDLPRLRVACPPSWLSPSAEPPSPNPPNPEGPTRGRQAPPAPLFPGGEKGSLGTICISMKTRLRGQLRAVPARRLRDGFWALPLAAPRRSAPAPPPPAPAPPPSRSHSLPGFDLCLTTVTSHGLQGSFVGSCKVLEPPEGCRRSSS